ncbi:MAG: hypothetical protein OXH52_14380 [Gammaproteobacteria bacterium]|nr:hypothetical protein [Gammaproteobacteria bacterium]
MGACALLLGGSLAVYNALTGSENVVVVLFWVFMSGGPLMIVGTCALRRPSELPRVLGAFIGAVLAPVYLWVSMMSHPNDAGADIGRGMVGLLMPLVVPLNMLIGAALVDRMCRPWWAKNELRGNPHGTPRWWHLLARSLGIGFAALGLLILWQAVREASPNPEIALWELVHHGILPAVPILVLGVCTAMLPSRLPVMCGVLIGGLPALACSSLLVDPNPDNHGQSIPTLVAYSLPLTLPVTVGLGGLLGNYLHRIVSGPPR